MADKLEQLGDAAFLVAEEEALLGASLPEAGVLSCTGSNVLGEEGREDREALRVGLPVVGQCLGTCLGTCLSGMCLSMCVGTCFSLCPTTCLTSTCLIGRCLSTCLPGTCFGMYLDFFFKSRENLIP